MNEITHLLERLRSTGHHAADELYADWSLGLRPESLILDDLYAAIDEIDRDEYEPPYHEYEALGALKTSNPKPQTSNKGRIMELKAGMLVRKVNKYYRVLSVGDDSAVLQPATKTGEPRTGDDRQVHRKEWSEFVQMAVLVPDDEFEDDLEEPTPMQPLDDESRADAQGILDILDDVLAGKAVDVKTKAKRKSTGTAKAKEFVSKAAIKRSLQAAKQPLGLSLAHEARIADDITSPLVSRTEIKPGTKLTVYFFTSRRAGGRLVGTSEIQF